MEAGNNASYIYMWKLLDYLHVKVGPIYCPEMSGRNYQCWLRNAPEERSSIITFLCIALLKTTMR